MSGPTYSEPKKPSAGQKSLLTHIISYVLLINILLSKKNVAEKVTISEEEILKHLLKKPANNPSENEAEVHSYSLVFKCDFKVCQS